MGEVDQIPEYTLTRQAIVACADRAIRDTQSGCPEGSPCHLDEGQVDQLAHVARTYDEFAIGDWYIYGRCGCLVGNLIGRTVEGDRLPDALFEVGVEFDRLLCAAVVEALGVESINHTAVVKVSPS